MPFELIEEEVPKEEESSLLSEAGRHILRTTSRIGEAAVGLPGDVFSLINSFVAEPITKAIGAKPVPYEQTFLGKILPTTETHKERMIKGTKGYLAPKNKVEEFFDNITSEASSLLTGGAKTAVKAGKLGQKAGISLLQSIGANAAGDITKDLTADEKKGAYAHLGGLFLLSFLDKKSAAKHTASLFKPLDQRVSQLNPVDASYLENDLKNLQFKVSRGTLAPSEKFVFDEAQLILDKIKNGKITPQEAWASKRSLTEKLSKILYESPDKTNQARARKLTNQIQKSLDETLALTQKQDPKFYKDLKLANKTFQTVADSNFASKFVEKYLKYTPITSGLLHLFAGPIGSTVSGAILPYQAIKILYRIGRSPELAKIYANSLGAAIRENSGIINQQIKKLDEGLQKEEKKDKFILVD